MSNTFKKVCPTLGDSCKGCPDCSSVCFVDGTNFEFDDPDFAPAPSQGVPALGLGQTKSPTAHNIQRLLQLSPSARLAATRFRPVRFGTQAKFAHRFEIVIKRGAK